MKIEVATQEAPGAVGPYSQGIRTGNLLFISGQIPIDPKAGKIVADTVEGQTIQVMKNIEAILKSQGLSFANVVKTTVYMIDLKEFAKFNEVYAQHLKAPYPARATVEVSALPLGARIEIETLASYP